MSPSINRPPRLNLLALPSLPIYYFGIMAVVIIGALFTISLPDSPLRIGPFLLMFFIILVVRDFLMQPEHEARRHHLECPTDGQFLTIRQAITVLADRTGLRRSPQLRLAGTPGALFALGTFRHGYIAIAPELANVLEKDLLSNGQARKRAEAALLHEIQHLSQRDIVVVGLARSLLKVGAAFSLYGLMLMMGIAIFDFAFPIGEMFTPAYAEKLRQIQPELGQLWLLVIPKGLPEAAEQPPHLGLSLLYLLNGFVPLIVTIGLMWMFIWPRLLRVRELYADAGVARIQKSDQPMWDALAYYGNRIRLTGGPVPLMPTVIFRLVDQGTGRLVERWLGVHPTSAERDACLQQPARVFASPFANGMLAGLLAILLDLLLVGAFSVIYAAQVPGAIPVLIGMLAASVTMLPLAMVKKPAVLSSASWIIGLVVVWRIGWHLLNLLLFWSGALLAPDLTSEILSGFVHNMAGALIPVAEGMVAPADLIPLAIISTFYWMYLSILLTVTLTGGVVLEWSLRRLALTWYALPGSVRHLKWLLAGITLWSLVLVVGLWLPLAALVAPVSPTAPYSLLGWLGLCLNSLLVFGGAVMFAVGHVRYGRRCPNCRKHVPGWFSLGRSCSSCKVELWPELQA